VLCACLSWADTLTNLRNFCAHDYFQGVQFVDVREPWEHEEANLGPKFKLMPLSQANSWCETCLLARVRSSK